MSPLKYRNFVTERVDLPGAKLRSERHLAKLTSLSRPSRELKTLRPHRLQLMAFSFSGICPEWTALEQSPSWHQNRIPAFPDSFPMVPFSLMLMDMVFLLSYVCDTVNAKALLNTRPNRGVHLRNLCIGEPILHLHRYSGLLLVQLMSRRSTPALG